MTDAEPTPEEQARIDAIAANFVGVSDSLSLIPEEADVIRDVLFRMAVNIDENGLTQVSDHEFRMLILEALGKLEMKIVGIQEQLDS